MAFWNRARNKVNTVSQRPDAPTVSVVTQDENFQRLSRQTTGTMLRFVYRNVKREGELVALLNGKRGPYLTLHSPTSDRDSYGHPVSAYKNFNLSKIVDLEITAEK